MDEGPHRYALSRRRDGGYDLGVPRVLRAHVDAAASEVTVTSVPGAEPATVQLVLSGLIMAVVLSIRGHTLLHASAVERDGRALAVVGRSGAGKSTLAGMLCAAGADLVSDDHLRIDVAGEAYCWPSAVRLRARTGGLGAVVAARSSTHESSPDGRLLIEPTVTGHDRLALHAVVVPLLHKGHGRVEIERVTGVPAAVALLAARALPGELSAEWESTSFERALDVAGAVPVWRALVPWREENADSIASQLLELLPPTVDAQRPGRAEGGAVVTSPTAQP
jgi:hypothetical protein